MKKVNFTGEKDPIDIISEILEKNGIKESLDDYGEILITGNVSAIETLYSLSSKLVLNKITDVEMITSLQEQLKISKDAAKNIALDAKRILLPLAETNEVSQIKKVVESLLSEENIQSNNSPAKEQSLPEKSAPKKMSPSQISEIKPKPKQPSGSDRYREEI